MITTDLIDNCKHTYVDMNKHHIDMMGSTETGPQYLAPHTDATTVYKNTLTPRLVQASNK